MFRAGFTSSLFFDQRIASRQLGNVAHLTNSIILLVEAPGVEESPEIRCLLVPYRNLECNAAFDSIFER